MTKKTKQITNPIGEVISSPTSIWYNITRAIEVAKTANKTLTLYFNDEYKNGFSDYEYIKEFYKGFFDDFVSNGDMKVEFKEPDSYKPYLSSIPLEKIQENIDNSLKNAIPTRILDGAEKLLKISSERLKLSIVDNNNIIDLAKVIAQMSNTDYVGAEHIAEAIQYSCIYDMEKIIFPEEGLVVFGSFGSNDITIKPTEIDNDIIDQAIEYLKSLKK